MTVRPGAKGAYVNCGGADVIIPRMRVEPGACGIYIHIPFCQRKCAYCDFNSYAGRGRLLPAYVNALKHELRGFVGTAMASTVYFGGGTPSLLSPVQVETLLDEVRERFGLPDEAEVTLEANPGTVGEEYLFRLRSAGVTRLSLGAQSFDDGLLAMLGRIHSAAEAVEAYEAARRAGFDNVNLDLIYALPGQTPGEWRRELTQAVALGPEHLSLYALSVEEGTPLAARVARGEIVVPDADVAAELHEVADAVLRAAGYEHYEISNYARAREGASSRRCRHNLIYWRSEPYLGFGAGAHSFFEGRRWWNVADPGRYIVDVQARGVAVEGSEEIDANLGARDWLMMGLRVVEGVDLAEGTARYGLDLVTLTAEPVAELASLGLLAREGTVIALTPRGRLLANEVLLRLLSRLQVG
ncbi:MAG: radical SAM family heme chaperone HemW [Chloroflexota bacterium]